MKIAAESHIGEMVDQVPRAALIFEILGIEPVGARCTAALDGSEPLPKPPVARGLPFRIARQDFLEEGVAQSPAEEAGSKSDCHG
jgi:hypothetical protein